MAGPAQLNYKSLSPTWCVNLGAEMLLLGFISEETTFLMNHCSQLSDTTRASDGFWLVEAQVVFRGCVKSQF